MYRTEELLQKRYLSTRQYTEITDMYTHMYHYSLHARAQTTLNKRYSKGHTLSNHNMSQVLHNIGNIHVHSQQVLTTNSLRHTQCQ